MENQQARARAERIASGHAFQEHVVDRDEFPEVRTREEFADLIHLVLTDSSCSHVTLRSGRHAYWSEALQMIVITDNWSDDGGTAFRPPRGRAYFRGLI